MGAEWFESILIDYEPAANWFCWVFICLIRATGGNGFREIGHPELAPGTRLQTVEVVFLSAQHDPDGDYIKRWVPELKDLPSGLLVREPWRPTAEPSAAVARKRMDRNEDQSYSEGPDRIQMARRTLTKGGASVAVWWSCVGSSSKLELKGWPKGYPLPIFPPSSFFDIEKVAIKARKQQAQKASSIAKLRHSLGRPLASVVSIAESPMEALEEDSVLGQVLEQSGETRIIHMQAGGAQRQGKGVGKRSKHGITQHQDRQTYYDDTKPTAEAPLEMVPRKRRWAKAVLLGSLENDFPAG
jgi:hypothetical protein